LEIHYAQDLPDGKFWYPLGTGQFWDEPIGIIGLYIMVPQSYSISANADFDRISFSGKTAYAKQIIAENPDYDLAVSAKHDNWLPITDSSQSALGGFLEFLAAIAVLIPIAGVFLGGWRTLKKDGEKDPRFRSVMLLLAYFAVPFVTLAALAFLSLIVILIASLSANGSIVSLVSFAVLLLSFVGYFIAMYFLYRWVAKAVSGKTIGQYFGFIGRALLGGFMATAAFFLLYHALVMLYYWL
jgi:hypothetical protein